MGAARSPGACRGRGEGDKLAPLTAHVVSPKWCTYLESCQLLKLVYLLMIIKWWC